jgi:hypothetical protein
MAGATVVLSEPGRVARETTTDTEGAFAFEGLVSGRYNLTVSANGFQEYLTPIQLAAGGHRSLRVFLEIVSLREAITVHGGDVEQLRDEVQRDYEINKSVTPIEGEMMLRNNPVNNRLASPLFPSFP